MYAKWQNLILRKCIKICQRHFSSLAKAEHPQIAAVAAVVQNSSVETENAVKGQGDRQVFLTGWGCHTDISRLAFKETLNIKSGISSKPKETCPNILPTLCVCVYFSKYWQQLLFLHSDAFIYFFAFLRSRRGILFLLGWTTLIKSGARTVWSEPQQPLLFSSLNDPEGQERS